MILFVYTLYSRMVGLIFWDADNWLQCAIFNAIKMMRVENVLFMPERTKILAFFKLNFHRSLGNVGFTLILPS